MNPIKYFSILLSFSIFSVLWAEDYQTDFEKRSRQFENGKKFPIKKFQNNKKWNGKRIEFKQWQSKFTSLGQKKAPISVESSISGEVKSYDNVKIETMDFAEFRENGKLFQMQNWDQLREAIMVSKYGKEKVTSASGKQFEQLIDDISLRDINRFQSVRNKTDKGIPTTKAGGGGQSTIKQTQSTE